MIIVQDSNLLNSIRCRNILVIIICMKTSQNNQLILNRYQIQKQLMESDKKKIFLLYDQITGDEYVMKVQKRKGDKKGSVIREAAYIASMQGYPGIIELVWSGRTENGQQAIILSLLGDKLSDRLQLCGGKFSIKTVCMLGIDILKTIHSFHIKGFIHRDIGIDNFQFGTGSKCNQLYINDFLSCKRFVELHNRFFLLKDKKAKNPFPQGLFSPLAVYNLHELSLKDDIESLLILLVYLYKGSLPWQSCFTSNKKISFQEINKKNQFINIDSLCSGMPSVFNEMLRNVRALQFDSQPNYYWYIMKLKSCLYVLGLELDYVYDWMLNKQFMKKLEVKTNIPTILTDYDIDFVEKFLEMYGKQVDIDQINLRHEAIAGKLIKQQYKQSVFEQSFKGNKIKKDENFQTEKRKKEQCRIM